MRHLALEYVQGMGKAQAVKVNSVLLRRLHHGLANGKVGQQQAHSSWRIYLGILMHSTVLAERMWALNSSKMPSDFPSLMVKRSQFQRWRGLERQDGGEQSVVALHGSGTTGQGAVNHPHGLAVSPSQNPELIRCAASSFWAVPFAFSRQRTECRGHGAVEHTHKPRLVMVDPG